MYARVRRSLGWPAGWLVWLGLAFGACGPSSPVSRELGAQCEAQAECDERCLRADSGFPDGFCTRSCDANRDCPGDSLCADIEGGVCLFPCRDAERCEFLGPGWTCATAPGRPDGEVTVCAGE